MFGLPVNMLACGVIVASVLGTVCRVKMNRCEKTIPIQSTIGYD